MYYVILTFTRRYTRDRPSLMSKWKQDSSVNRILAQSCFLNLKLCLHHVSLAVRCLGSKSGRIAGRCDLMWRSRSLLRTVLELLGRNPGMLLAVRFDIWNRYRRCTSRMWLSCWCDVTRGRPERWRSLVLSDCLRRLNNDCIEIQKTGLGQYPVHRWILFPLRHERWPIPSIPPRRWTLCRRLHYSTSIFW
jgi:hypothetical protein